MGTYTGYARDFTDSSIAGLEIYVHPQGGPNIRNATWDRIFVDKPFPVEWTTNASFEVDLEPNQVYQLQFLWPDPDLSRVGQSWWSHSFRVPTGDGGNLSSIVGFPARNGMVRVRTRDPNSSDQFQYVYNESTGDLFERTA